MSLTVPKQIDRVDNSLNSSASFNSMRLPHALTSSTQRLGIDVNSNTEQLQPLIAELNERGLKSLADKQYSEALMHFQEGENLLEMGAGCGKSIDRQLILTILTNEAFVYTIEGRLDLAKRYLQAVIYNINAYLEHPAQEGLSIQIRQFIEGSKSQSQLVSFMQQSFSSIKTFISRFYELSVAQLRYAWLLALEGNHSSAILTAQKSIVSLLEHFKLSLIFFNFEKNVQSRQQIDFIKEVTKQIGQFDGNEFESLEKQMMEKIDGCYDPQPLSIMYTEWNKIVEIRLEDYFKISPISYEAVSKNQKVKESLGDFVLPKLFIKYLNIGCIYYLIASEKMKEANDIQRGKASLYLLGSQEERELQRKLKVRQSQQNYLKSMRVILKYLPVKIAITEELIEAYRSRFNEQIQIRLFKASKQRQNIQKNLGKTQTQTIEKSKQMKNGEGKSKNALFPPVVQHFLDLSMADSINLTENTSGLDVFKQSEEELGQYKDEEIYFQFMPKKSNNSSNPLFQATLNLLDLKNQAKEEIKKELRRQQLKKLGEKKKEGASRRKFQIRIREVEEKTTSRERKIDLSRDKTSKITSKLKTINPSLLNHYSSAGSIYTGQKVSIGKAKSGKRQSSSRSRSPVKSQANVEGNVKKMKFKKKKTICPLQKLRLLNEKMANKILQGVHFKSSSKDKKSPKKLKSKSKKTSPSKGKPKIKAENVYLRPKK